MALNSPIWNGNLIIAGLFRGSLWRMAIEGENILSTEELITDSRLRIRKLVRSQAGKLNLLSYEINGKVIRNKNSTN
ncbi:MULTISPECIES: PQQ-dependent sugar dehydrogenase [Dyadobacter]|uniref:Glucose/Sorbosone dehydrogenase domain-containing protein n=1 Tax=Dyadobacter psychrotolerans TaxID=2541721 RepID=A0A4R5DJ04_9BACT|nr:PQQ-dependent sugar dehydrogenase [Dyadobacter psychrotolerans]TDE13307.1 hypothetical protein E0F88_19880 [Dyadobacter psychrotolerans]